MYRSRSFSVILVCSVLLALLTFSACSYATITFEKTYGGAYYEEARCVQQTLDGGYIVAGWTKSYGAGKDDWYLVRTDSLSNTVWERVFGLGNADHCYSVLETPSGDFVASGKMAPFGGHSGYGLLKVDSLGEMVWTKNHGIIDRRGYVREASGGGYIIVGSRPGPMSGPDVCLVKTDSFGELIWSRRYGGSGSDFGYDVCQTTDGGFIAVGETWSFSPGRDIYLVKTDSAGEMVWAKTYGGSSADAAHSVIQTPDEGFLVAGYTCSSGAGTTDVYLIKIDSNGDSMWARTYGGPQDDWGISHQQTSEGGYIIVGGTWSFGAGEGSDVYLIKTDSLGDIVWTRTYGGTENDRGDFVRQTADGGYIIAGATSSFGAGDSDVYLIKTDQYGRVRSCDPVEPWEPRTQGYWRRQCKGNPHKDICAYVNSIHVLAGLFGNFDCDSICDLMSVHAPENDMCRRARRQFMTLLLNVASGKLAACNCLENGREVGDVIAEIDSLLSGDPDFHTCEHAKTLADNINNGIGIVPCDTVWAQAPPRTVELASISITPNPFAKSTVIEYEVKTSGPVRLELYDRAGRFVRTLVDCQRKPGFYKVKWDGLGESSRKAPTGVYFLQLQTGNHIRLSKLILIR